MKYNNIFIHLLIVTGLGLWAIVSFAQEQGKPRQDGVQKEVSALAIKSLVFGTGVKNREQVVVRSLD